LFSIAKYKGHFNTYPDVIVRLQEFLNDIFLKKKRGAFFKSPPLVELSGVERLIFTFVYLYLKQLFCIENQCLMVNLTKNN